MKVLLVTPAPPGSLTGNRRTAQRWAEILNRLRHAPQIAETYQGQDCDLMIALHARKSAASVDRFRAERPDAPLVVALTGTDLYGDLPRSESARRSLEQADRLVTLHRQAADELDERLRDKVRVILQSAEPVDDIPEPAPDRFEICVLGHLRSVKDPFRAAEAVRLLPSPSRVLVLHVGSALDAQMERRALAEQEANPRYRWLGPLQQEEALRVLAASRALVLSSLMEGGANVIGEAAVHGVPVIASRIPGSIGLLGEEHPAYFPTGDTEALADLIGRIENDPAFLDVLRARSRGLAADFSPGSELESWSGLMHELFPG